MSGFQYTVKNPSGHSPPVAVIRTHNRATAREFGAGHYWLTVRCTDRARYGIAEMERRAASVCIPDMFGARDRYVTRVEA